MIAFKDRKIDVKGFQYAPAVLDERAPIQIQPAPTARWPRRLGAFQHGQMVATVGWQDKYSVIPGATYVWDRDVRTSDRLLAKRLAPTYPIVVYTGGA